jgi:hypothetical protein
LVASCIHASFQRDRKATDLCHHVADWKGPPLVWSLSSRFEKITSAISSQINAGRVLKRYDSVIHSNAVDSLCRMINMHALSIRLFKHNKFSNVMDEIRLVWFFPFHFRERSRMFNFVFSFPRMLSNLAIDFYATYTYMLELSMVDLHAYLFSKSWSFSAFSLWTVDWDTIMWLQRYASASELNRIIHCVETMRSHLQQSNHTRCTVVVEHNIEIRLTRICQMKRICEQAYWDVF